MPQDNRPNRLPRDWFSPARLGLLVLMAIASAAVGLGHRDRIVSAEHTDDVAQANEATDDVVVVPVRREPIASVEKIEIPQATVHIVYVRPFSDISIALADELMTVRDFVETLEGQGNSPVAVINGGFFDPNNAKTTSHIVIDSQSAGSPADNEGLTGNPKMQPYLPQIYNRSEFRVYDCPLVSMLTPYDIAAHDAPIPDGCNLVHAIGAGPQLLPTDTSEIEAFTQYENGERVRDAIGSVYPNARSAIGIHEDGSAMLIMAAQRSDAPGLTLEEVAGIADSAGAIKLLNLDGGSSSSLYYANQLHLGRLNPEGKAIERPVKSVIVVE